ncbi:3-oxoacyl-[acyl-carrier protein] reductase [Pseudonocardia sp. Ae168_Ps1]|uniref:SDR family NAD(P)-dependent oxidoreductase n=1 Tax=unclassified Pseudonocardia TaxID=2619320 RepID=UPI00094ACBD2|nr:MULTISPECIES: SDR family NAD(P)-dependent oxidoreductase [unclassified Pseudonocardia]OLL75397.1 3-oxoacyl-[acyl-carrier protein] reductase [Pseudonocardia sp. Ae150A_Ps1]OLL81392.1 3-oxoacyl-[acyl-carrier protein] reductase [Pseudonocardia sp. Ae168_Ps1]OLL84493.1 3-oxoacyl-[acyl-carrier protein] reductase [Pseudonocardia sp. Ae263_Ps1]OLL95487.1 3-oxoacyl-[acyl-carrier protein] reductase [Pseudonocardia sp. Ae356_Ps1]
MDLGLGGRRAIVTGGSRGIGLATARALAAEGARVALLARDPDALEAAATSLRDAGAPEVLTVAADTTDDDAVRAAVRTVAERFGGVDVLVNAAARPASAGAPTGLGATTDDAVRVELETKLLGYLRCARAVAPLMTAQGWGRIVNVSGLNARRSTSLVGSVRNVTVVHPGVTETERTAQALADRGAATGLDETAARAELDATTTIGRITTAAEVADVITFLCSPRSVAINGDAVAAGGGTPGVTHY